MLMCVAIASDSQQSRFVSPRGGVRGDERIREFIVKVGEVHVNRLKSCWINTGCVVLVLVIVIEFRIDYDYEHEHDGGWY